MNFLNNKTLLITGGTGSFGNAVTEFLLKKSKLRKIIIFSRDENKQFEMRNKFTSKNIRFFLGDVRDEARLEMALKNVDIVIHAAALKHVMAAEYNPFECIKTNIYGAQALISAAIKNKVKKVIALSTDKACNPVNLYGATKLCAEKLFINANQLSGPNGTIFSAVRYGNVLGSRGSIIPYFRSLLEQGVKELPLTHADMTRFFISLEEAVKFVLNSINKSHGGEVFIPKMNSIYISDLIKIIDKEAKVKITGIRPGEKIHEMLCSEDEMKNLYKSNNYFVLYSPSFQPIKRIGTKIKNNFLYVSNSKQLLNKNLIEKIIKKINIL